jgi:deoxycytidine triphosphate deaminase
MLLSDRDITAAIAEGRLGIEPYDAGLVQPSSIDVRLDRFFRVFNNARYTHIDPAQQQDDLTTLVEPDGDEPFVLHPGEFVLGSTLEIVTIPDDLAARLEGKSSLGRLGLLTHSTAGFVGPGVLRAHHAGAVQRGEPADHALARDEDRPAVPVPADRPVGASVRLGGVRLPLPGPAWPDAVSVLPQLHPRRDPASVAARRALFPSRAAARCPRHVR